MGFFEEENLASLQRKVPLLILAAFVLVILFLARLYYLQIYLGDDNSKLANEILIREEKLIAKRGKILDRNGIVLADTRPYLELMLTPQYLFEPEKTISFLSEVLTELSPEAVKESIELKKWRPKFEAISIYEDMNYQEAAKIKELLQPDYSDKNQVALSGIDLRSFELRRYRYPEVFSHVLGYLKEVDKSELAKFEKRAPGRYKQGDLVGAAGLERAYDDELRGQDGQYARVVDARGRELKDVSDINVLRKKATIDPQAGYDLKTTLSFPAQQVAHESFQDKEGSVVAMDPRNGEVLVLYSSPGYDANRITKNVDKKYWQKINLHEDKFLFNRALQAMYPPASTYKAVMAVIGIFTETIDPEKYKVSCYGGMQFGNRRFHCWNRGGHGRVDLKKAIAQSCDVFFYNLGLKLGVDRIAKYVRMMGLGKPTGIEIPFEKSGLVPSSEWKERRFKEPWQESETLSVSIGQSFNLVTMLQNALTTAMIVNDGYKVTPHLGKEILQGEEVVKKIEMPKEETPFTGHKALGYAREGMVEVVHGYGTARRLRQSPNKIAGKTGTAQVVSFENKRAGKKHENHGLFIGYAPYDDPKIVVSVIVEHGRGGSISAAPIAHKVIDAYLGGLE